MMLNQNTLHGDVLDILFANRNKQYGAYLLRRTYPDRLKRSIGLMLGAVVLLSAGFLWKQRGHKIELPLERRPIVEITIQPPPADPKPIEKPIVQRVHRTVAPPQAAPPVVTTPFTPLKLVDKVDPTKALPDMPTLDNKQIGPVAAPGPATGVVQPGGGTAATGGGNKGDEGVYDLKVIEKMPEFPGGEEALRRFFMRYLQTPDDMEEGAQVRVVIRFVVGKDGSLSAYAVEKSGGEVFDAEVIRVLKKMPKWTPGIQNGHPVSVYFNLPVTFMHP
ncbi:energy transducer TonB [Dinghuibacter silviterrae]|nr:energy transducer TonB [Dinghuibacter silviterrae]